MNTNLAKLDQQYVWHPFTQMRDWLRQEPIVIISGKAAVLRDSKGRAYLDANSSIWTNLHGHAHPKINAAITRQLNKIAHSSALGLANEPASLLAQRLVEVVNGTTRKKGKGNRYLSKVFFSDDGSTAMEVALKLAYECARRSGLSKRPRFLSLEGAYHGDTIGAVSLGHIDLFHKAYSGLLFKTDKTPAPYCYRCRFNRAKPERADAREYRKCGMECLDELKRKFTARKKKGEPYAGFVFEPLMQGAAGMIAQPEGWLRKAAKIAREHGALLIADEVMTGFGRTGLATQSPGDAISVGVQEGQPRIAQAFKPGMKPQTGHQVPKGRHNRELLNSRGSPLFACQKEGVQPDFMALAKGMTGGYVPMAATLTTQAVFDAFLGKYEEFKTFFHGHSYTANQVGAAASLASMDLLDAAESTKSRLRLENDLAKELESLWQNPNIGDIRRVGLIAGIELVKNWKTREPFALKEQAGIRVCKRMAELGVLTRSIGNVIVIMPPYCTTTEQVRKTIRVLRRAVDELLTPD